MIKWYELSIVFTIINYYSLLHVPLISIIWYSFPIINSYDPISRLNLWKIVPKIVFINRFLDTKTCCWPWLHKSVQSFKHLLSDFTSMWHILKYFSCTNIWVHVTLGLNKYRKAYCYFSVNTWLTCPHITNTRWQANAKCAKHTWSFKFE